MVSCYERKKLLETHDDNSLNMHETLSFSPINVDNEVDELHAN